MINCFCGKCCSSVRSFTKHYMMSHKLPIISAYDYLIENGHIELFERCPVCETLVKKLVGAGGQKTCSDECRQISLKKKNLNRKQSREVIQNRLKNTDQRKKEEKRKETMIERYGSIFFCDDEESRKLKISESHKGKTHSKEHHEKINEKKKTNKTNTHNEETKQTISRKLKEYYQKDSSCVTISRSGSYAGRNHVNGYIGEIYYRSSYEKLFIEKCIEKGIKIQSAETSEYRVRYEDENSIHHWYYPDFFIPQSNTVIEIKPYSLIEHSKCKIEAARKIYGNRFKVLTLEDITRDSTYEELL